MSKRKALEKIDYNETSSQQNYLSEERGRDLNSSDYFHDIPTEKRKKISSDFHDLSQLGDFNKTQSPYLSQRNQNPYERSGTIEAISLKNFKCHSYLEFNLHHNINFILGRNGSGKSAVMDAIILCLGGKTTSTGRQASAKTFIKTNCEKAELSISLRNVGDEKYKPDLYGSRIIIERKLAKDGQSLYRIFNDARKLISNKKQELDSIVEHFNIQVDNPVCFLNQETSKHFLNSSNKADKYKLFMKASQLESMKNLQRQIESERQLSESLIKVKESYLPKLEEELFEWEEKYKKCQSVERLKKKLSILMHEYSWAVIIEWEKIIEQTKKERNMFLKSKEKHETKIQESKTQLENINTEYDQVKLKIQELNSFLKTNNRQEEITNNMKKASQCYKAIQLELKKLNVQLEKKELHKRQFIDKLNEEKNNTLVDHEKEKKQKEANLNAVKSKLSELQSAEKAKQGEIQTVNESLDKAKKAIRDKEFDMKNYENRSNNLKKDIESFRAAQRNKIFRFGENMHQLVEDVKANFAAKKFSQMPRGPIGMYLQPKSSEWSLAIEQCLGQLLYAFVCNNYEDERFLQTLISKHIKLVHKRPRIIVMDFKTPLYDHNKFRPDHTQYPTVYEMLHIKEDLIANTLFDQRRIESVLLLPNREIGKELIENNSTQNCYEAFLKNGDQLLGKPSFRMYTCPYKQAYLFVENSQNLIEQKQSEIKSLSDQMRACSQEIDSLREQVNSDKKLSMDYEKQLDSVRRNILVHNSKLKEIENINIPEPTDLKFYEDEISNLTSETTLIKEQISAMMKDVESLKANYEKANAEYTKNESEQKQHFDHIDELKNSFDQLENQRNSLNNAITHYNKLLCDVLANEKEVTVKLGTQEVELNKMVQAANELSPRIETKKQSSSIEKEIQLIEQQIQQSQKLHGNEEEITKKYLEVRVKHKKIIEDMKKQKKFLSKLFKALKDRETKTESFIQSKALRCAIDFSNYLSARNFKGELKFDHNEQKLDIVVHPNKVKDANAESTDLKSLSGGERSFSTVAFLLSLWSIVESPILFLDEFDVFMDQINRSFAMDLIVSAAKDKLDGQYIFLTPQEMGTIKPDEYIKMFKMPDPRVARNAEDNMENDR